MDFLYEHPRKHAKLLKIKNPAGYYVVLSPEQLLKEIEKGTPIGNKLLDEIQTQQDFLNLIP